MAKSDDKKSLEERVRHAAKVGHITFASTDEIEDHEKVATEFLKKIFKLNYDECFVSDESTLSDFSTCVLSDDAAEGLSYEEAVKLSRSIMKHKIEQQYGIETSPHDTLVSVFEQIRRIRTRRKQ